MGKMVYISCALEDKQIANLFVEQVLCAGSGLDPQDVFYSEENLVGGVDAFRERLSKCALFIMIVSAGYRQSAFCLNEMGAAWMVDNLPKQAVLLPDIGFDTLGWLNHFDDAIKLSDSEGLDKIHDLIMDVFATKTQTATWNYCKFRFISGLQRIFGGGGSALDTLNNDESEEMDILGMRERFDQNSAAVNNYMRVITDALRNYSGTLSKMTNDLNRISENPKVVSPEDIRRIFRQGATETDQLSSILERVAPDLQDHFDSFIEYAVLLQRTNIPEDVKQSNREAYRGMIKELIDVREAMFEYKATLNKMVDLDNSFKKARNRLMNATDLLIKALSFCISRATNYWDF